MSTIATPAAPRPAIDRLRWLLISVAALLIVLLLVIIMGWMILAPEGSGTQPTEEIDGVQMVKIEKDQDQQQESAAPDAAPPPPPAAPPALARADLPPINAPSISITPTPVEIAVGGGPAVNLGSGMSLGASGVFGGFSKGFGNGGGGGGGGGFGNGEGFSGKELIPLSTARPQMPEWACKQKIKGWVEAVFTVMPNGRVRDVKIVDAQPRGVYEAAAVESISNWIYNESKQTRQVDQRVEMDPADCQYNWH